MKIGIDARLFGPKQGGLGRYIEQLIKHLEKIDLTNQYVLFFRKDNWNEFIPTNPNFEKKLADTPWYGWREQTHFLAIINAEKLDLMHFPHWNMPIFYHRPFIVTIHDLIMYHFPRAEASTHGQFIYWLKDSIHRFIIRSACHRARQILTTSEFTKADIVKNLNIDPKKITVTYQAPFEKITPGKLPLTIKKPYILYVGNCYPHKNLPRLIEAWQQVERINPQIHLVLVGRENYFYRKLLQSSEYKKCSRVIYLGYQDDTALEAIYENASLYVFPSLYEGFGLPPLEAILRHIPVIASDTSCLPEILGDSAEYFDPADSIAMATKIIQLLNDTEKQKLLINNGQKLLQKYSSDNLARQTLQIYQKSG
ncbi:MAG: glycosyltransferase family 1 protein [bacterium]|nr:glycosyltransferase family 1 protein [bacterium]